jgi:ribosome-binding protein aMBF1 (putative translation factor)
MNNIAEYNQATEQAKANLSEVKQRGNDALGESWEDIRKELLTPEERTASNLRVAIMEEFIKARNEQGISQRELEQRSGVKQPIISRMERGTTIPQLDTILKLLGALGKTLYVGDIQESTSYSTT